MLTFLLILAAVIALSVLPIMYVARAFGVGRGALGWIILSLLLLSVLSAAIHTRGSPQPLGYLIAFLGGGAIFTIILETTLTKGLAISLVGTGISLLSIFLLTSTPG